MSPRLLPVLSRHDLPEPELQAARLDGEVFAIDECFSPIDEIEQRYHRARSLAVLLPERLIAEQRTAAWILGALDRPPTRHQFCVDIAARVRAPNSARLTVREVVIDETEFLSCAGLRVTAPLRTVIDLARFSAAFSEEERNLVAALMPLGGFGVEDCEAAMERRRNLPGKQRAMERIRGSIR
ncbi:MAG: type IV toxin-antitoxin system AbiEi family antitoxin [Lacisediminihabitans sp.]